MTTDNRKTGPGPGLPNKKGGGDGSAKNAEEKDEPTTGNEEATASGAAPEPSARSREITKRRA